MSLYRLAIPLLGALPCFRAAADGGEATPPMPPKQLQVDAEVPAGNIVVERIDGDTLYLHQDLRDTATSWFYWPFRVRHAGGKAVTPETARALGRDLAHTMRVFLQTAPE